MRFGTLRLTFPGGQRQAFPLDQPSLTIGRASDNGLIIEDSSVSRRHARLTVDSGNLLVEDLGSANGTFLGAQRLPPNTPSYVGDNQVLRLGDVRIEYDAPAPVPVAQVSVAAPEAEAAAVPPAPAGPSLNASLVGPAQPIAPGSVATVTVTLHNRGTVVDEFTLAAGGVPAEWVKFSQTRVPLLPGAQQTVNVTLQPPRRPDATAGEQRLIVAISSTEQGSRLDLSATFLVLPYHQLAVGLQPVRARRSFQVQVANQGNTAVPLSLAGGDEEAALAFAFGSSQLSLGPGEARSVPLQVTRRQRAGLGVRETRSFTVSAIPADHAQPEAKANGQLMVQSAVPLWLVPLVLILLLCACVSGVFGYATLCPTLAPTAPLCPAQGVPVIRTFSVSPAEVFAGDSVTLTWEVGGAERVELTAPFQNSLSGQGSQTFTIAQDTVFTLHASNPFGAVDRSVTVKVLAPLATVTPTLRPTVSVPTPTDTPTPTATEPPTASPTPTPNGALGIFESQYTVVVDLIFGGSLGSQRVCTPHPVQFGASDVGKTLTVSVLDFFAENASAALQPAEPVAGLYRSLTGPWENGHTVNLWDQPNAELVAPAATPLSWVVSAPGDYIVCLEVPANDYYDSSIAYRYVRYQLVLTGG